MMTSLPAHFSRPGLLIAGLLSTTLMACGTAGSGQGDAMDASGGDVLPENAPLFVGGCPQSGLALARQLGAGAITEGPDAIGRAGDWLLANEHAAFVIEEAGRGNAYYYYGGILVDAVAITDCRQATPEQFGELELLFGEADFAQFDHSILRAFRGDHVEIVNDGSDGQEAIVRVHGVDDYHWLVELQLLKEAFKSGEPKALSDSFGVEIVVDYVLAPDSPVLRIDVHLQNLNDKELNVIPGAAIQFGDTAPTTWFAFDVLDLAGFHLDKGLPWMVAGGGDGAMAFAIDRGELMTMNIAGVMALIDFKRSITEPFFLAPAGESGDRDHISFFVSVGATDRHSATAPLQQRNPEPIPDLFYQLAPIEGRVADAVDDTPLVNVPVDLQAQDSLDDWRTLDTFRTDDTGRFFGELPDFGTDSPPYRLRVDIPGRPIPDPLPVVTGTGGADADYAFALERGGTLRIDVRDDHGVAIPAKALLYQDGAVMERAYTTGATLEQPIRPGDYQISVTRGYEYTTHQGTLTITADQVTDRDVTLTHAVDTSGFLCYDGHAHASPSSDSTVSLPLRIRTAAAEGLDVIVSTDHEFIADWSPGVVEAGLKDWIATVIGQEVTATLPEHTNMYPVEPWPEVDARNGIPRWYGLSLAEIFSLEAERGAGLRQLNHPREYLEMIGYDLLTGEATLADPTQLSFAPDAELWTFDFELIEIRNNIMAGPGEDHAFQLFDIWMSFFNLGHRISAVGVSDVHGLDMPGTGRTYYASPADDVAGFHEDDLVDAMLAGRALVSNGAFARVLVNQGAGPGDTITDTDGTIDLAVRVEAIPEVDIAYAKVYVNCDQAATVVAGDPHGVVKLDESIELALATDAHLVVLGFGEQDMPRGLSNYDPTGSPRMVTNPVFVDVDGNGVFDPPGGKTCTYDLNPPD